MKALREAFFTARQVIAPYEISWKGAEPHFVIRLKAMFESLLRRAGVA